MNLYGSGRLATFANICRTVNQIQASYQLFLYAPMLYNAYQSDPIERIYFSL
jgi:hypothetical protein